MVLFIASNIKGTQGKGGHFLDILGYKTRTTQTDKNEQKEINTLEVLQPQFVSNTATLYIIQDKKQMHLLGSILLSATKQRKVGL